MNRKSSHSSGRKITPVPDGVERPFWSVMISVFNRTQFLEQALRSILNQAPGPELMQIEVVDDHSTLGDIESLVAEVGKGRIGYFKQPANVGLFANWNTCIERARGYWLHQLHDDDLVLPGFYQRMESAVIHDPGIGAAFCRQIFIDGAGAAIRLSPLERDTPGILPAFITSIASNQRIQISSIVVKREVYEKVGGIREDLAYVGDWEMWLRVAAAYPIWYEPHALACFRNHQASMSSALQRRGLDIAGWRKSRELAEPYLPPDVSDRLKLEAHAELSQLALDRVKIFYLSGNLTAAYLTLCEGLKCCNSIPLFQTFMFRLFIGTFKTILRQILKRFKQCQAKGTE